MYQEKRPTAVTVIGWAWIVISGLMFLSAVLFIVVLGEMAVMTQGQAPAASSRYLPLLAVVQIGVAMIGLLAGIQFLRMRPWSRLVLEILSWLLLSYVVGFTMYWIHAWFSMAASHGPMGFTAMGGVMGIAVAGIYGIPIGIMLRYLRGEKLRKIILDAAN